MNLENLIPVYSKRILLDRFAPNDWESYYKIELSHEQHRYNFEKYNPRNEKETKEYIKKLSEQNYNDKKLPLLFAVRLQINHELIGFIGFKNGKLIKDGSIEVYYSIYKEFWNNGFGTEALKTIIQLGFEKIELHRIFAGCDIDNFASKKIMEKAGMQFESFWRKDRKRNNKWTDGLGFSILKEDYLSINSSTAYN